MIWDKRDDEIFEGLKTLNVNIFFIYLLVHEQDFKAHISDAITVGTFQMTGRGLKATRDIRKGADSFFV